MTDLHISQIKTDHKIDELAENIYSLITEDKHLILELDLNRQVAWTEKNHRRIGSAAGQRLRIVTKEGSRLLPRHVITITVYEERTCRQCGMRLKPDEVSSHEGHEVHDACWPAYVKENPELFPDPPDDEEFA